VRPIESAVVPDPRRIGEAFTFWGSAGRAATALADCPPLQPVADVVEFNVSMSGLSGLDKILRAGRKQLAAIPGVRSVATGKTSPTAPVTNIAGSSRSPMRGSRIITGTIPST